MPTTQADYDVLQTVSRNHLYYTNAWVMSYHSGDLYQLVPGVFYNTDNNGAANMDYMFYRLSTGSGISYHVHSFGFGWFNRMNSYPSQVISSSSVYDLYLGTPTAYLDYAGSFNGQNYSLLR